MCLFVCLLVCSFVCLFALLFVCLLVCLFVCLFVVAVVAVNNLRGFCPLFCEMKVTESMLLISISGPPSLPCIFCCQGWLLNTISAKSVNDTDSSWCYS